MVDANHQAQMPKWLGLHWYPKIDLIDVSHSRTGNINTKSSGVRTWTLANTQKARILHSNPIPVQGQRMGVVMRVTILIL